jgi:phosphohistidine phosphatase
MMVFGHNPEFSELARRLSNGQIGDMPTCGVAELHFGAKTWGEVGEQPAAKVRFESPKS